MIFVLFITCIYLLGEEVHAIHVWSLRPAFRSQLSFYHVGPRDWIQNISLSIRHLYWLSHLGRPKWRFSQYLSWETCGINYQDHVVCPLAVPDFLFRDEKDPGFIDRQTWLSFSATLLVSHGTQNVFPSLNQGFMYRAIFRVLGKESSSKNHSANSNF